MRYELYIDVYFLINFAMDLALLAVVGDALRRPAPWRRLAAGAALGALAACLTAVWDPAEWGMKAAETGGPGLWLKNIWFVFRACLEVLVPACVMVRIAFRPGGWRELVKAALMLLFLSACVCGFLEALCGLLGAGMAGGTEAALPALIRVFLAAGVFFLLRFFWSCASEIRKERRGLCRVTLRIGTRAVEAAALYDTGNRLREPGRGEPVHIVTERLWRRLMKGGTGTGPDGERTLCRIPFRTVGNPLGFMEAVRLDALEIRREKAPVLILPDPWIGRAPFPVSQDGSYEMLLHEESFYNRSGQKGGITDGDQGIDTESVSL